MIAKRQDVQGKPPCHKLTMISMIAKRQDVQDKPPCPTNHLIRNHCGTRKLILYILPLCDHAYHC